MDKLRGIEMNNFNDILPYSLGGLLYTPATNSAMADNYLEKKYEDLQARKAKEQRLRQAAWKKRMDAYRRRLEEQARQELTDIQNDK